MYTEWVVSAMLPQIPWSALFVGLLDCAPVRRCGALQLVRAGCRVPRWTRAPSGSVAVHASRGERGGVKPPPTARRYRLRSRGSSSASANLKAANNTTECPGAPAEDGLAASSPARRLASQYQSYRNYRRWGAERRAGRCAASRKWRFLMDLRAVVLVLHACCAPLLGAELDSGGSNGAPSTTRAPRAAGAASAARQYVITNAWGARLAPLAKCMHLGQIERAGGAAARED